MWARGLQLAPAHYFAARRDDVYPAPAPQSGFFQESALGVV